jgi:hypothetical protein
MQSDIQVTLRGIVTVLSLLVASGCQCLDGGLTPLAPDARLNGPTKADVYFARHALAIASSLKDPGPIVHIGTELATGGGQSMTVHTPLRFYDFTRSRGGGWRLVASGYYSPG